ncbi:MAG TPA: class I tRNA ligase family protein [Streptosporangiaceae bacterium]|nr:class I tRNA ligase family protein [Streptosporangiaceae bacterium]
MFPPLPDKPDATSLEQAVLDFWDREGIFGRLRTKNADGPRFSFIDGPVTANKILGVHTAWGRTLKDVFQRYKGMRGYHQRYQNGFDCQGLWIEVGVERELGLNSKLEIEEYGLAAFAGKCREVVEKYAGELIAGSVRLGQWMDWGRDYYTSSDTNITYIWKFLQIIHERGWLHRGHRPTEWCPRCGTSISAHELVGNYVDRADPSLAVRFPLLDRPGDAIVIWTTTPWTLPANVAAAVRPDAEYGRLPNGDWMAVSERGDQQLTEVRRGSELVGWRYRGPFDDLGPGAAVEHRVVGWDEVSLDEGTGIVHIAPGCGTEDFELGRAEILPTLMPVDESGHFYPDYGWLAGMSTAEARDVIIEDLRKRSLLVDAGEITHRYPECWRCHTPLIFRISDDWFISVAEIREPMRAANRTVEWIPAYMGARMDDWLANMSDWNISRRRYYGLPLPFYPCSCGHLTVIGSLQELAELATAPIGDLPEVRRPWIDAVKIRCPGCSGEVSRIAEVGDVWLDAGIVPFSTLGWENPTWAEEGYATGAAKGLTTADLPDHSYWEQWFPADWVSEMREQIRLWFYSQLFMSVALTGRAPYRKVLGYEKMLAEDGREMHGSWGNAISADEAFARMGADVMRWQYSQQPPNQNLLFGFGPGKEIQRRLLTLWNSVSFFVNYANIAGFSPELGELGTLGESGAAGGTETAAERSVATDAQSPALDRWLAARTAQLVADATAAYEQYLTVNVLRAFESYLDDLSNWYIRRSRRRFWNGDKAALATLWGGLVQALRVVSPVTPFLAEHLWQVLVVSMCPGAPASVFLAGWPEDTERDERLLAEVASVRQVVELGRRARAAARIKVRQPLRRMVVDGVSALDAASLEEIADELRVKQVVLERIESAGLRVRPNFPVVAPRLGRDMPLVKKALDAGEFTELDGGRFEVAGHVLEPNEVLVERLGRAGWEMTADDGVTVALDTGLDDDLLREGRVYEVIHRVNTMRKEAGLELTDRIKLTLPAADQDLAGYQDWIMAETLAVSLDFAADQVTLERS